MISVNCREHVVAEWLLMLNGFVYNHPTVAAVVGVLSFVVCGASLEGIARRRTPKLAFLLRCLAAIVLAWPLYRLSANGVESIMNRNYVAGATGARALVAGAPLLMIILYVDNMASMLFPRHEGVVFELLDRLLGVGR